MLDKLIIELIVDHNDIELKDKIIEGELVMWW